MTKLFLEGGAELIGHPTLDFFLGAGMAGGFVRCDPDLMLAVRRGVWERWRHERPTPKRWMWITVEALIEAQLRVEA